MPVVLYLVSDMLFTDGTSPATPAAPLNLSNTSPGQSVPAAQAQAPAPAIAVVTPSVRKMDLLAIDQVTKRPIPGLVAIVTARGGFRGRTGADGHVQIPLPAGDHPNYFNFRISGRNYVPKRMYWATFPPELNDGIFPANYTLEMEHGVRIFGKVVNDAGQPVAGAAISFNFTKRYSNPHEQIAAILGYSPIKSDAEGNWSFPDAPANCDQIVIAVSDKPQAINRDPDFRPFNPLSKLYDGTAILTLHR